MEHAVVAENGKKKLDVALADDVTPTWKAMEKVSLVLLPTFESLEADTASSLTRVWPEPSVFPTSTLTE